MHAIVRDWREAGLSEADQALCDYAEKLTLRQSEVGVGDLEVLRSHGFDDRAIHDATQVIGYFNYISAGGGWAGSGAGDVCAAVGETKLKQRHRAVAEAAG